LGNEEKLADKIKMSKFFIRRLGNPVVEPDILQCHCYNFVHENVGNLALNTRPTILNQFFARFVVFGGCSNKPFSKKRSKFV
jgi:hypothetical protein